MLPPPSLAVFVNIFILCAVLQIAIISFFVWVFPIAGILVVFINVYEIR